MAFDQGYADALAEVSRLRSELEATLAELNDAETAALAAEALAHNVADVLENGPRLAWTRKTAPIAIDRQNRRVLQTGLGALGVGTMWIGYNDEPAEWANLPERDSAHGEDA
jgi:hypothetical protein